MALPCCPPFAQGGLLLALANTTGQGKESMGPAARWSLPWQTQPAKAKRVWPPDTGPAAHNRPFPWHWARTALWSLPGDGLSHPAQCLGSHIALPRWAIEPRPVVCWASLSPGKRNRPFPWHWVKTASKSLPGDGLSHPEHPGPQRIPTGDRNGSSGTLVVFAIFSSFFLANIVVIFLYKSNKTAYDIW